MGYLKQGTLFSGRYLLKRILGVGGYSEVWLAQDIKTGNLEVALKIFAPEKGMDEKGIDLFSREYSLVFNLIHPHLLVPKHFDVYEGSPYLLMPYCQNGSLNEKIGEMTERELARFMQQAASALSYLHSLDPPIIHQDIKPDNFLIDDSDNFLLADFGISSKIRRVLTKSMGKASSGTMAYMPPEKWAREKQIIKAGDVFSLGVTLYEIASGELPFGEQGGLVLNTGAEIPDLPKSFSAELNNIVRSCLAREPWERPTAEQLEELARNYLVHGYWGENTKPQPQPQPQPQSQPQPQPQPIPPPPSINLSPWIITAIVVVAGIVGAIVWPKGPSSEKLNEKAGQDSIRMSDSLKRAVLDSTRIADSLSRVKTVSVKRAVMDSTRIAPPLDRVRITVVNVKREVGVNPPNIVTDTDGNIYKTVTVGSQTWMAENLKTTKYNDGTPIPLVNDANSWEKLSTAGYCWYNLVYWHNNEAATNKATYGALYNWSTVNTGKLCPTGWHVPADAEWTTLTTYLGGGSVAGGKLKETGTTHWLTPNTGATNETGFTTLPGSSRNYDGTYGTIGYYGTWWSSTEYSTTDSAWYSSMHYNSAYVTRNHLNKRYGFSVRCLLD